MRCKPKKDQIEERDKGDEERGRERERESRKAEREKVKERKRERSKPMYSERKREKEKEKSSVCVYICGVNRKDRAEKQRERERKREKEKRKKKMGKREGEERNKPKGREKSSACVHTCGNPKKQCSCSPHAVSICIPCNCRGGGGTWKGVMVSDVEARGGWQTECKMRREKARDTPAPPRTRGRVRSMCVPSFPRFLRYGGEQRS